MFSVDGLIDAGRFADWLTCCLKGRGGKAPSAYGAIVLRHCRHWEPWATLKGSATALKVFGIVGLNILRT